MCRQMQQEINIITNMSINTVRRQAIDWEKMYAKDVFDKGLVFKLYKELFETQLFKGKQPY